jgi:hypothetical protein
VQKRPLTPTYILFYILFWPDTWRILIGVAVAFVVTPMIMPEVQGRFNSVLLHVMIACIGYTISSPAGRGITAGLKKLLLKATSLGNRVR